MKDRQITKWLKQYFLGTETKKFYNNYRAIISEFSEDTPELREKIKDLESHVKCQVYGGRYFANFAVAMNLAVMVNAWAKDLSGYTLPCICGILFAEFGRNYVFRDLDKIYKEATVQEAKLSKELFKINSRNDSGYDGWLQPEDEF